MDRTSLLLLSKVMLFMARTREFSRTEGGLVGWLTRRMEPRGEEGEGAGGERTGRAEIMLRCPVSNWLVGWFLRKTGVLTPLALKGSCWDGQALGVCLLTYDGRERERGWRRRRSA